MKAVGVFKKVFGFLSIVILAGLLVPHQRAMPVSGAGDGDFNPNSFWAYPWGRYVTHRGVDIFAQAGTPVISATPGIVLQTGLLGAGGNVVFILGPKWRVHYDAHLREIKTGSMRWVSRGDVIGSVGTTGNTAGKPAHLHDAIVSAIPDPWRIDSAVQGWKKMFYLNPVDYIRSK